MKKYFKIGMLLVGFLFAQSTVVSAQCPIKEQIMGSGDEDSGSAQASHTLIIYYDKAKGDKALMKAIEKKDCVILNEHKNLNRVTIKTPQGWDVEKAVAYFNKVKGVTAVNRNGISLLNR